MNSTDIKDLSNDDLGTLTGGCLAEMVKRYGLNTMQKFFQDFLSFSEIIEEVRKQNE